VLSDIFALHGYPYVMVSDNATISASDQFRSYSGQNGIFQKFVSPGHPATNGITERNVQTLKTRLKVMANEPFSMHAKLQEILFRYRATPLSDNKILAEMYLQRNIHIQFDAICPMEHVQNTDHAVKSRELSMGERVQTR
jgi:transposase InsO family protein